MRTARIAAVGLLLMWGPATAQVMAGMEGATDRASYSLGFQIGTDLRGQQMGIDEGVFLKGLGDGLAGREPTVPPSEMNALLTKVKRSIEDDQKKARKNRLETFAEEARDFMVENATKEGVVSLPSGAQYRVVREGTGASPAREDRVKIHYRGTTLAGAEFGSSYLEGEPEVFHVNGVVPGLTEVLQLMKTGAKWEVFLPYKLAFGDRGPLEHQSVIYEIELLSIEPGG